MSSTKFISDQLMVKGFTAFEDVKQEWFDLQANGIALPFQNYAWCKAWFDQFQHFYQITPLIIVGRNSANKVLFLLPLQIRKQFGFRVIEWLGQQAKTACSGIFDESFVDVAAQNWFSENLIEALDNLASFDVLNLRNMPELLISRPSPLRILHKSQTADGSLTMNLTGDYESLLSLKRSSRTISKMRRRDERLTEEGILQFEVLHGDNAKQALEEALHLKNTQLTLAGVSQVFSSNDIAFYCNAIAANSAILEIFTLRLNGKMIAAMIGAKSRDCFWLLVAALAPESKSQLSPGDYLLRRTISHCCSAGVKVYDFAFGEQDYKQVWADQKLVHYNAILARRLRGVPLSLLLNATETLRRFAKQNGKIKGIYYAARKKLFGSR